MQRVLPRLTPILTTLPRQPFCIYKIPYNINREEHRSYLKRVESAEQELLDHQKANAVPRRKRRVYDRPKHDTDIAHYRAWRLYEPQQMLFKFWAHGAPVAAKLMLQPKWVVHAFGLALPAVNHYRSTNVEYSFEDNNFSKFLLYEYRNTTLWKPNEPHYDYDNQEHLPVRRRKTRRLSYEQFWQSEERFEFRLNCSAYAEKLKFKRWVEETIEASKHRPSYDELIDKKFGKALTFNSKEDRPRFEASQPAVLHLTPEHYNPPKKGQLPKPSVSLPKRLDEKHRVSQQELESREQEAQAVE